MNNTSQRLQEIAEQEKQLADEKAKLLAESKDADLETVKRLCKQHEFTATQLRGCLGGKSKKKTTPRAPRKAATKKTAKAK
jgi:DNA-binding protein H-NS